MSSESITQNDLKDILNGVFAPQKCWGTLVNISADMSLTNSAQKIPLINFSGNKCAAYNNGIRVEEAGVYEISGAAYCNTGYTVGDVINIVIYVDNGGSLSAQLSACRRAIQANPYEVVVTGPLIMELNAGAVAYLYAHNQGGARGKIGPWNNTRLSIKQIA